jgi:sigma-E factor negative regulatory protein RseC
VEDGQATLELDRDASCGSCGLCGAAGGGKMRLVLDAIEGISPGQTVIVAIDRTVSIRGIALLFGLPLLGLVIGALVGFTWPIPSLSAEASGALLAVALLVVALLFAMLYDRKVASKSTPQPIILRIESE